MSIKDDEDDKIKDDDNDDASDDEGVLMIWKWHGKCYTSRSWADIIIVPRHKGISRVHVVVGPPQSTLLHSNQLQQLIQHLQYPFTMSNLLSFFSKYNAKKVSRVLYFLTFTRQKLIFWTHDNLFNSIYSVFDE